MHQKLYQNIFVQWLLILLFLMAIRGSEGFGQPISLDVNDTIVFTQIAANPSFPADAISAQFVKATANVGISFLPALGMQYLGVPAPTQYIVLYFVQLAFLSLGLLTFLTAFGKSTVMIALGVLLAYLSGFTGFGRYLALGAGFKIVTSGFALAIGFIVLGLFLRGWRYTPPILAALLATYHPSHGFVLLAILGAHALYETITRRRSVNDLLKLGAATAASLIPFLFLVVLKIDRTAVFDHTAWWDYVFNKTSNLTPLQDGVFVVAAIMATMVAGIIALRAHARTYLSGETAARGILIITVIMILWVIQIVATEIFRSIPVAQLALTRATPYTALIVVALLAQATQRAFAGKNNFDRISGTLLTLAAIGAALPNKIPPFDIPTFISAVIETEWLYTGKVIQQANIAILAATLSWWLWLPHLSDEQKRFWTRIFTGIVVFTVVFFGLRIPSLAAILMLVLYHKPLWSEKIPVKSAILYGAIILSAALLLFIRNPWHNPETVKTNQLTSMIEQYVPEDGMIITVPAGNKSSEYFIPTRAAYLGEGESQYLFYAPFLVDQVKERSALLGVAFTEEDSCHDWPWKPMCRRIVFAEKSERDNPVWRGNISEIKKQTPAVTHILMPEEIACKNDKIIARAAGQVLIPVNGIAKQGCKKG
jgi:hypothetical protein